MKKLINFFIVPLIIMVANPIAGNSLNNTYESFEVDVSDYAGTWSNSFTIGSVTPRDKTINFRSSCAINLPDGLDPTEFTAVSRTDDAAVKIVINEDDWQDNKVIASELVTFNPFNLINFKNIKKINTDEPSSEDIKNNMVGIGNSFIIRQPYFQVVVNIYVGGFWFVNDYIEASQLLLPILVECNVNTLILIPYLTNYNITASVKLGSILRFS